MDMLGARVQCAHSEKLGSGMLVGFCDEPFTWSFQEDSSVSWPRSCGSTLQKDGEEMPSHDKEGRSRVETS